MAIKERGRFLVPLILNDWGQVGMEKNVVKKSYLDINHCNQTIEITNGNIETVYDLNKGTINILWNNEIVISNGYSIAKLEDGDTLNSNEYSLHKCLELVEIEDDYGKGIKLTVLNKEDGLPNLLQSYYVYEKQPFILTQLTVESTKDVASNYMAPLVTSTLDTTCINTSKESDLRTLFVPFDNDKWVRYHSHSVESKVESFEVTAVFDNYSRKGMVIGSVSHDCWKTGIKIEPQQNKVDELRLLIYGGATNEYTRDTLPHGYVKGKKITSPKIFIGFFDDYRDGLEEYGKVNAVLEHPLKWEEGVPFGWNSWSAVGSELNYDLFIQTSDFYNNSLQNHNFENKGTVYINFDSFWDNLTEEQLIQSVSYVHNNGQKAGIYFTPFAYWSSNFDRVVEGTNNLYTYQDIMLKDNKGNVLPELDGGFPIDPSHPGTIQRLKWQLQRFVDWGFDYVKLDFMTHGALEGVHYNQEVSTGIQAYNFGMKEIVRVLDPAKIGRPFFINLSIAPMFPSRYAHSRRISCDAFGKLKNTEYMLNSLSYGWWMSGTIYPFNDPDHTVIYKSYNEEPISETEALSRFNASVIAGTVLLGGDNFTIEEARNRAEKIFTNNEVNNIAKKGLSFIPVEGNSEDQAVDTFFLNDIFTGEFFVAVFNFDETNTNEKNIKFTRLGLDEGSEYMVCDLWSKETFIAKDSIHFSLKPAESKIVKVNL